MTDSRDLLIEDFQPHLGEDYEIDVGDGRVALTLTHAEPLPRLVRESGSFRLEWRGPSDPVLPQGTYGLQREGQRLEIFIVPVERNSSGTAYEAIFN